MRTRAVIRRGSAVSRLLAAAAARTIGAHASISSSNARPVYHSAAVAGSEPALRFSPLSAASGTKAGGGAR